MANKVVATQIAESALAMGRTPEGALMANPLVEPMLATPEGRDYFSYIVSCALPADQEVSAIGQTYRGSIGLAPSWADGAMTAADKRWVSACLLARINAYGISVEISMRGAHPALTPTDEETASHTLVEGAFYGDVFVAADQKFEMAACRGAAQADGEQGELVNRDCAEPGVNGLTQCGLAYAGDCLDYTPATPSARACSYEAGGSYQECHTVKGTGIWAPGSARDEIITVYVKN